MAQGRPRNQKPLTIGRILTEALALADESGLPSLSMRALGRRLGVEAMAIYHHIPNKEALLDALVDAVFTEIERPVGDWRPGMRARSASARAALRRHPWAIGLLESRLHPGPVALSHQNDVVGFLRGHGFSPRAAAQVLTFTDAYVYGFVIQESELPTDPAPVVDSLREPGGGTPYPHLAEIVADVVGPGYDFADEFEVGLDLLLDAIETLRLGNAKAPTTS